MEGLKTLTLAPAMLLGFIFMAIFLWKMKLINKEKVTWSPVSASYLVLSVIGYFAFLIIVSYLVSSLHLPDLMKETFDIMQSNWVGILCIAVLGPVLEELLFRGAITRILLNEYKPGLAILFSALIFGIFHINPAQVLSATLIGLVLGWMYYKTASLIPCILLHVLNNSLSVYLSLKYPEIEELNDVWGSHQYTALAVSAVIFILIFMWMKRVSVPYPWKQQTDHI